MNPLISAFKDCAHQAGELCNISNGQLVRNFGLGDFLENMLTTNVRAPDIAIKALEYFCDEGSPHDPRFRFAVLSVGIFLDEHQASKPCDSVAQLQQPLKDLVTLLIQGANEQQLRAWIEANFR